MDSSGRKDRVAVLSSSSPTFHDDGHIATPRSTANEDVSPSQEHRYTDRRETTNSERARGPLGESLADVLATNAFDQLSNGEVGYFGMNLLMRLSYQAYKSRQSTSSDYS